MKKLYTKPTLVKRAQLSAVTAICNVSPFNIDHCN
jgi:hypothetical protein